MLQAAHLIVHLLEKVSVLLAAALVLLLMRPAEVWLGETGARASIRRRAFLVAVLGALAIWGTFLGFRVDGTQFDVRMVGIIVAGFLGGSWVGMIVGVAAGLFDALRMHDALAMYIFAASVLDGLFAGLWSRKLGNNVLSVVVGSVVVQIAYHVVLGAVMAAYNFHQFAYQASQITLHVAKIAANAVGVSLFMGLLNLVSELDHARREVQTSRDQARSARLEALQYQIKPHFLFNILNTLAYLIRTEPTKARELTLDLSEFLRYTLASEDQRITLRDELKQIERYVELERARFGDGLSFKVTIPPDEETGRMPVPPLILQPLVENAIRHGARGGSVQVEIEVEHAEDAIHIRVLDDGPGPPTPLLTLPGGKALGGPHQGGVGLKNVRERLERFYRGSSELILRARDGENGACVEFSVPLSALEGHRGLAQQAREQLKKVVM